MAPWRNIMERAGASLQQARGGNVAIIFALSLPPIAVCTVAGIQLSYIVGVRSATQDAADEAALQGAQQLGVSPNGVASRAQSLARAELARRTGSTFSITATLLDPRTIQVAIDSYTPSFFGDELPAGGFRTHVVSTAQQQSQSPLCVLVNGSGNDDLTVTGSSQLNGGCLVHSDHAIAVAGGAQITAGRVEAVSTAQGTISPAPLTGGLKVGDPFQSLDLTFPSACAPTGVTVTPSAPITAGLHNDSYRIPAGQAASFGQGVHYFCGSVTVGDRATLSGSNVTLIFDKAATISTAPTANVALKGSSRGRFAGFVVISARNNTTAFDLDIDQISDLTGAVYAPGAKLVLNGQGTGAQASDWTVIVARAMEIDGAARLQINTNYVGSPTPVPPDVGDNTRKAVTLIH